MQPILIQGAMHKEIETIISQMKNIEKKQFCNVTFYEGTIEYISVVVEETGIGIINATIATTIAINNYDPRMIINQGCAGACSKELHVGDIVIGNDCININSNITPDLKENMGSNSLAWELYDFKYNKAIKVNSDVFTVKEIEKNLKLNNRIFYGTIGSGDIWDNEIDRINMLNKKYDVLCEDMESIATYAVCQKLNVPVLGIRMISNNKLTNEAYDDKSLAKLKEFQEVIIKILNLI